VGEPLHSPPHVKGKKQDPYPFETNASFCKDTSFHGQWGHDWHRDHHHPWKFWGHQQHWDPHQPWKFWGSIILVPLLPLPHDAYWETNWGYLCLLLPSTHPPMPLSCLSLHRWHRLHRRCPRCRPHRCHPRRPRT
jgi:hypothetical protein